MGAASCPPLPPTDGESKSRSFFSCGSCEAVPEIEIETDSQLFWDMDAGAHVDVLKGADAEGDELAWMNFISRVLWPYMRKAMMKKAGIIFKERMGEELAKHPEIKLTELSLDFDPGDTPPKLSRMRVFYRNQKDHEGLNVDSDFSWQPDDAFHLIFTVIGKASKFPIKAENIGIAEMKIKGTLSCVLSPLLDIMPCVGTGQAFFLDAPSIDMKLKGVKGLGPIGGVITNVLEGVVSNVLADGYILPHRFMKRLRKDLPLETMINCRTPLPLGILQVEILEGRDLPAADTSITGQKTSDPYVEIKIGCDKVRTSTVSNTLCPVWEDEPGQLFVYNATQIVQITVHDDDLFSMEVLGLVLGHNVEMLSQKCESQDGAWVDVNDPNEIDKIVGQLKIRTKYFGVAEMSEIEAPLGIVTAEVPPYLLTVKILGLEGEDRGDMRGARCTVEQIHPHDAGEQRRHSSLDLSHHDYAQKKKASRLMSGLEAAHSVVSKEIRHIKDKAHKVTGLGFGHRENGVAMKRKTGKALPWGIHQGLPGNSPPLPPLAIRAMEKLYTRENWKPKEIADMFGLDEAVVQTAVSLRGNFEVIWCEAVHFLQPAHDPFKGQIKVSVQCEKTAQVRGADDYGYVGDMLIDLEPTDMSEDQAWNRRVRAQLFRVKGKVAKAVQGAKAVEKAVEKDVEAVEKDVGIENGGCKEDDIGKKQSTKTLGESDKDEDRRAFRDETQEASGILLEVLVEIRRLTPAECKLEPGQRRRSRDDLREASMNSGVRITKA